MPNRSKRQQQAKVLRIFRKIHRTTGALLFVFFFVVAITGFLLGWKKNSNEILLPRTYIGTSTELKDFISLDSLHNIANKSILNKVDKNMSLELDRIDIRKENGTVKFIYKKGRYGVQLDGATGKVLNIGKRYSDIVENIHDGSIMDNYLETDGYFKLFYTSVMSIALFIFTITGFWLWYGPKRMRKKS